jgi:hypothetical protein
MIFSQTDEIFCLRVLSSSDLVFPAMEHLSIGFDYNQLLKSLPLRLGTSRPHFSQKVLPSILNDQPSFLKQKVQRADLAIEEFLSFKQKFLNFNALSKRTCMD